MPWTGLEPVTSHVASGVLYPTILLRDTLESAGILKGKHRSNYSQVYRTMKDRSQTFEQLGGGLWRLNRDEANDAG